MSRQKPSHKSSWHIETTPYEAHIKDSVPLGLYEQFPIHKHLRRSEAQIAENSEAIGEENLTKFMALKVKRLIYHEIAALIVTEIELQDEKDLEAKIRGDNTGRYVNSKFLLESALRHHSQQINQFKMPRKYKSGHEIYNRCIL